MIRFGFFKPGVEVLADRVVITRRATVSYLMLALVVPGIAFLAMAFQHRLHSGPFALGALCMICAAVAVPTTPWLTPARIELGEEGLAWGAQRFPASEIKSITASANTFRNGPYKQYSSWRIAIVIGGPSARAFRLDCGQHATSTPTTPLLEVERALNRVLWDAQHRPGRPQAR